jgi:serine/threonine-protein kinase
VPLAVAVGIALDVLYGLDAAHEATTEAGEPLAIVHRDVSPQNILVGKDGVTRVLDFGIAKAAWRLQETRDGQVKGKLGYMSPEQLEGHDVDRRSDLFAAAVVLWEMVVGARLFDRESPGAIIHAIATKAAPLASTERPDVPSGLDDVIARGLSKRPETRFASAADMAHALEESGVRRASPREIALWVQSVARDVLGARAEIVDRVERAATEAGPEPSETNGGVVVVDVKQRAQAPTLPIVTDEELPSPDTTGKPRRRISSLLASAALLLVGAVAWSSLRTSYVDGHEPLPVASVTPEPPPSAPPPVPSAEPPKAAPVETTAPATSSPPTPSAPPRRSRPGCNPPYTIDEHGVKRFITRCL